MESNRVEKRQTMRVAVADDSGEYLRFLETTIRRLYPRGVTVVPFQDAITARKGLSGGGFDLFICDINFDSRNPKDDTGLHLLTWVRKRHPGIPVVMMTRYLDQNFEPEARERGAAGFLEKPISLENLRKILERFLSSPDEKQQRPEDVV